MTCDCKIDISELADFTDREELMALSEAFLAWEEQKETQSREAERRSIALNLLRENISLEMIARTTGLTIASLQQLQSEAS
jgi:predicted Rossmann fold nucleotide-binding protein DprA/Smf involved in DNA uptake